MDLVESKARWLGVACCLALLAALFQASLRHLVITWSTDDNYNHGFLVPLLSLYFAREAWRRSPFVVERGVAIGFALVAIAVAGRLAAVLVPIGFVNDVAFVMALAGIVALFFGAVALRRFGFALFFLVFMIPLPIALYTAIAAPLQLLASQIGGGLLNAIGIPALCEGNLITLPGGVKMFVAEACSGMRQLTGFLALSTAVAYLSGRPWWYRAVVVASSAPIALAANVLRVTLTGWIMYRVDPALASGHYHTFEGLMLMAAGLAMLWAECRILNALVDVTSGRAARNS